MNINNAHARRLSGLLALLGVLALAAPSAGAVCSSTWIGGADGSFGTAGNWSPPIVPDSSADVCITATTATDPVAVADTYTVTLNGNFSVHSLTLGGPNGTQTLVLSGGNSYLSLGTDSTIAANGIVTVGNGIGGFTVLRGPGRLTNSGQLNTVIGNGNPRYLRLNITNNPSGTVNIGADTRQDAADVGVTLFTNNGAVAVTAGGSLSLSGGSSFTNTGGTVTNSGTFSISGGTFTQRGGAESGNPVLLNSSTLDDDVAAGTGFFTFMSNGTLTGTGTNPGVAPGQVVTISAANNSVNVGVDLTNTGTLTLGDSGAGFSVLRGARLLTNSGQLNTVTGHGDPRYLRLNITNSPSGTVNIAADTWQDAADAGATVFTNNGTLTVEAPDGSLTLSGGSSFVNTGGTVTNNGTFSVNGGTFTQRGGAEAGNPVLLSSSTLDDDVAAATGFFTFMGNATLTGSGSNPGVAAGQTIVVAGGNSATAVAKPLTNAGTITLGDDSAGYSILRGSALLTNSGQLNTIVGHGDPRYLRLNITNSASGTVNIGADARQDAGDVGATLFTNNGAVALTAGGSLSLSGGSSFANNEGTVANSGAFSLSGGMFTQRGTESGNAVLLHDSTLDDDVAAGAGAFSFTGNSILTGTGNNPGVAPGQVLTIRAAGAFVNLGVNLTNAGTITLGDSDNGFSALRGARLLTNNGQLNTTVGGGGTRYLRLNITNGSGGTIDIAADTRQDAADAGPTVFTNNGTLTVEATTGSLALSGGSSFVNTGGTVTNNGAFSVSGGTFTQRGGAESGNPVLLSSSTLDDDVAASAGLFTLTGDNALTGSGSNPGVAAGQTVTVTASGSTTVVARDLTNTGTITLGDNGGNFSVLRGPGGLTNSGQLNTVVGGGNSRYLRLNITNSSGGTVDIAADTRQDAAQAGPTTFVNNGTVKLRATGRLALSGGSSFAAGASGTFAPTIDANAATFGQLTAGGGAVTLTGKLLVTSVGSPALNSTWPIISNSSRAGQFTTLDFGGYDYDVQYTATGVTLVALATPTPTATGTMTATPTHTSTPTITWTETPIRTLTPTLTSTRTPTPVSTPTQTATYTATLTRTATSTPSATPSMSGTPLTGTPTPTVSTAMTPSPTPTGTPTLTPAPSSPTVTATSTPAMITVSGTVRKPGPPGSQGPHGLIPAAGVTVEAFACEHGRSCLTMPGILLGSAVTDAEGAFSISIPADVSPVVLAATVDGVRIHAVITPHNIAVASAARLEAQAADVISSDIDPISEAAARLLDDEGLQNYGAEGIDAVTAAVEAANAQTTFAGNTVEEAADRATEIAASDPTVQMELQDQRFTPTPTATPTGTPTTITCVGDCNYDGTVTIDELLTGVGILLETLPFSDCAAFDYNADGMVTVDELTLGVNNALGECPPGGESVSQRPAPALFAPPA